MIEEKYNKKGNLVICKHSSGGFSEGSVYEIREDGTEMVRVVKDDNGVANGWVSDRFELYTPFTIDSKLHTDTPNPININQATSDVIILCNDDGTKVIMVNENGQWLQARTEQTQQDETTCT